MGCLPAFTVGGPTVLKMEQAGKATPVCRNAGVPLSRNAYQPCLPQAGMSRYYGVKARVQEETKNWFLLFSQKLREIFSGFAIKDSLDSQVAKIR